MITSITERILLALEKNRSKTTLLEILTTIKNVVRPKAFCIDMWRPFRNAVYEIFGNDMPIVIDKYHVFALVNRYILQSKDIMEFGIDKTLPSFRPLLYSKKI